MLCGTKYQNFSGGFGSGKTTACCAKALILSAIMPGNMGVVLRETYPELRDTTRKTFFEILPKGWIGQWKESENRLILKNGSEVLFRHFENDKIKVGANLGWFFIDQAEEASEGIFLGLQGRLRRNVPRLYGLLAMNPNGKDWQYRRFVENKDDDYANFDSSTMDNRKNLPPGYIEGMLSAYSPDWIERFVYGKWTKMSGLILHEFDPDRHMIDPIMLRSRWPKFRGLDWGVDSPSTCVFIAVDEQGVRYVFDEYGDSSRTPEEHAQEIKAKSKQYEPFRASILDSSAFRRESDLKSVGDRYARSGLYCQPGTKDLLASILHVKHLLKMDKLKFVRGATDETVREMQAWKWGPIVAGKEKPARGNDHYLDAMRYALYYMDRKKLYSSPDNDKLQNERFSAKLTLGETKINCDAVTGLPA